MEPDSKSFVFTGVLRRAPVGFAAARVHSRGIAISAHVCAILRNNGGSNGICLTTVTPSVRLAIVALSRTPNVLPYFSRDSTCLDILSASLLLDCGPTRILGFTNGRCLANTIVLLHTGVSNGFVSLAVSRVCHFRGCLRDRDIALVISGRGLAYVYVS